MLCNGIHGPSGLSAGKLFGVNSYCNDELETRWSADLMESLGLAQQHLGLHEVAEPPAVSETPDRGLVGDGGDVKQLPAKTEKVNGPNPEDDLQKI